MRISDWSSDVCSSDLQDDQPEEDPAIDDMVDPARPFDAPYIRGDHRAPGTQRIGEDRRGEGAGDEEDAPPPALETQLPREHRIGAPRAQGADPRAFLRHLAQHGAASDGTGRASCRAGV